MFELVASLAVGAFAVASGPALGLRRPEPRPRLAAVAAGLLPALTLILFVSLGVHLHQRLGGWPAVQGTSELPWLLQLHASATYFVFSALLMGCLVWPLALIACLAVRGLRPGLRTLGLFAVSSAVMLAAMQLAPDAYIEWWWD